MVWRRASHVGIWNNLWPRDRWRVRWLRFVAMDLLDQPAFHRNRTRSGPVIHPPQFSSHIYGPETETNRLHRLLHLRHLPHQLPHPNHMGRPRVLLVVMAHLGAAPARRHRADLLRHLRGESRQVAANPDDRIQKPYRSHLLFRSIRAWHHTLVVHLFPAAVLRRRQAILPHVNGRGFPSPSRLRVPRGSRYRDYGYENGPLPLGHMVWLVPYYIGVWPASHSGYTYVYSSVGLVQHHHRRRFRYPVPCADVSRASSHRQQGYRLCSWYLRHDACGW